MSPLPGALTPNVVDSSQNNGYDAAGCPSPERKAAEVSQPRPLSAAWVKNAGKKYRGCRQSKRAFPPMRVALAVAWLVSVWSNCCTRSVQCRPLLTL